MPDSLHTRVLAPEELRALLGKGGADPHDDLPTRPFERPPRAAAAARSCNSDADAHSATTPMVRPPDPPGRSSSTRRPATALQICLEPVPPPPPARRKGVSRGKSASSERTQTRMCGVAAPRLRPRAPSLDPAPPTRTRIASLPKESRTKAGGRRTLARRLVVGVASLLLCVTALCGLVVFHPWSTIAETPVEAGEEPPESERGEPPATAPEPALQESTLAAPAPDPREGVSPRVEQTTDAEPASPPKPPTPPGASETDPSVPVADAPESTSDARTGEVTGMPSERLGERVHAAVSALSRGELTEARDLYRALAQETGRHVFAELSDALERQRVCAANEGRAPCD